MAETAPLRSLSSETNVGCLHLWTQRLSGRVRRLNCFCFLFFWRRLYPRNIHTLPLPSPGKCTFTLRNGCGYTPLFLLLYWTIKWKRRNMDFSYRSCSAEVYSSFKSCSSQRQADAEFLHHLIPSVPQVHRRSLWLTSSCGETRTVPSFWDVFWPSSEWLDTEL